MAWTVPWNLMGMAISGDVAGLTIYTDRFNRKVAFPKSPPKKPPTPAQVIQRARFKEALADWSALPVSSRHNLEQATLRTGIVMTGQNLYVSTALTGDHTAYSTVERQSGLTLPTVRFIE